MFPKIEEVIVSAVIIEIVNRSISFLINKLSKLLALNKDMVDNLRQLLLRVGAIIEEAEGRCITNKAMLHRLNMMRKEFYRGHYLLDAFVCQGNEGDKVKGHKPGHNFVLSRFNPAKRLCICSGDRESCKELMRVLGSLETALQDAAEFIMLSGRYPRISREPYNMYLLLDNCMFGRQMEMEHVLNFLLQAQAPSDGHLGVLPIIGPRSVGKSTLIEHACIDERVRGHFSRIVFLTGDDLRGEDMTTLEHGGVIKYDNTSLSGGRQVLIIVELDGDLDEGLWVRLYSASRSRIQSGSKIIITSRSNKIVSFGTTMPLRMQYFEQEAFWYFFKVRLFGSTDMMEHPKLASLAMDLARELQGCFMGANIISGILQCNVDLHFWNLALAIRRIFTKKNPSVCDPHQIDPWSLINPIYIPTVKRRSPGHIIVRDICKIDSTQNGAYSDTADPMVSLKDLIFGRSRATPQGSFDVVAWKSHIAPHYNCVFKCEWIPQCASVVPRKKRT